MRPPRRDEGLVPGPLQPPPLMKVTEQPQLRGPGATARLKTRISENTRAGLWAAVTATFSAERSAGAKAEAGGVVCLMVERGLGGLGRGEDQESLFKPNTNVDPQRQWTKQGGWVCWAKGAAPIPGPSGQPLSPDSE